MADTTEDSKRLPSLTDRETLQALPGLARVAVSSGWRMISWAVGTTVKTNARVVSGLANGESPAEVAGDVMAEWRGIVRRGLGLDLADTPAGQKPHSRPGATTAELRAKGDALLYDSADVWFESDTHPAYARILEELSPDEARILRFLAIEGPQPAIDVRTKRPLGVGSELVEGGLSMIGLQAGVRQPEETKPELDNLNRLGLIWFSREQVEDPSKYQVVEVQPDVLDAKKRAGKSPKTQHRSIHLTPFGEDFCETCFSFGSSNGAQSSP